MKRSITGRNRLVAGASILTAVGAVALGASVSSGAMASVPEDTTATMSMVSIDSDGTAFECSFDVDDLPILPTGGEVVAQGVTEYDAELPEGATGSAGAVEMGEAIEVTPELMEELGIDPEALGSAEITGAGEIEVGEIEVGAFGELGELESAGIAVAGPVGEGVFFEIGPDGEIVETEVTEGTPEQCEALREEWGS
jgi:hypothetical protein